jgi:hypothetical protein
MICALVELGVMLDDVIVRFDDVFEPSRPLGMTIISDELKPSCLLLPLL